MVRKFKEVFSILGIACLAVSVISILFLGGQHLSVNKFLTAATSQQPEVMNNFRAVFVTTPNTEVAKKIAQ